MEVTDFSRERYAYPQPLSPIRSLRTATTVHRGSVAGLSAKAGRERVTFWQDSQPSPDARQSRRSKSIRRRRVSRMSLRSIRSPSCFDATPSVFFYPAYVDQFSSAGTTPSHDGWCPDISLNFLSPQHKGSNTTSQKTSEQFGTDQEDVPMVRMDAVYYPEDVEYTEQPAAAYEVAPVRWTVAESEDGWKHPEEKDEFDGVSTLMLRGIPNRLTRELLWEELKVRGFQNDIDFFNLPGDMAHQRNVGYCFVNLTTPEAVTRFRNTFEGATLGFGKICHVGIGRVQGLASNLEACRANMDEKQQNFHPLAVQNGAPTVLSVFEHLESERKQAPTKNTKKDDVNTSLMLRNIPNSYTRSMLLEVLESRGLMKYIDFFYVPIDLRYRRNVGYCFVNVVDEDAVARFKNAIEGTRLENSGSSKTCEVGFAQVQGLEANIEAYRNSAVMYMPEKFHPMLFKDGVNMPFPQPNLTRQELRTMKTKKKGVSMRNWSKSGSQQSDFFARQSQHQEDFGVISLHDQLGAFS